MPLLVLVLFVLIIRLAAMRSRVRARSRPSSRIGWAGAIVVVLGALLPALRDAPLLAGPNALLASDAGSHLAIAQDIAKASAWHGWIPTYNGGFPIALHYPCTGWLLTAALLRLGVAPAVAVRGLGFVALLAVPLLTFVAAKRAGARASSAATGAAAIAWISPYIQFTGGWESFFVVGLLSQVLVVPMVVAWVTALVRPSRFDPAPLIAALCAATHPQVFAATVFVLTAAALGTARREVLVRVVRSAFAGGVLAVALYGPGMASMAAPFGWPPNLSWRLVGFGPARVLDWLVDGDLLDYRHGSLLTSAWIAATVAHGLRVREARSRALLIASVTTLLLCVWGPTIASAGALGRAVLSVFQPMRALVLIPLVATASIISALDLVGEWLSVATAGSRSRHARALRIAALPALLVVAAWVVLPPRFADLHATAVAQRARGGNCSPPIDGFDAPIIGRWLAEAPYGRTAFDTEAMGACASIHGAELARSGPLAATGGAGAHVGVHAVAFARLGPERAGSAARAEALGVRTLVHGASRRPEPADQWAVVDRKGTLEVSRRLGGTDFVGVGCVRKAIHGRDAAITEELFRILAEPRGATFLDDPHDLVALEPTADETPSHVTLADDGCDPRRATVREEPREPGAYEAIIEADAPVDVVFRATAYSGWQVRDGAIQIPTRRVAPGFFAARVGPGRHQLEAVVELPRWYPPTIVFSVVLALALSLTALLRDKLDALREPASRR